MLQCVRLSVVKITLPNQLTHSTAKNQTNMNNGIVSEQQEKKRERKTLLRSQHMHNCLQRWTNTPTA